MGVRSRLGGFAPVRSAYKLRILWGNREMALARPRDAWRYALRSREVSNFTYELANESELGPFVAEALGADRAVAQAHLDELRADRAFVDELQARLSTNRRRDGEVRLGKRRALYCAVRLEKPKVVVESGVHDGLGTAVLLRALERNAAEGSPGTLIGFDLNPDAGWLVDAASAGEALSLVVGDTEETLVPVLERDGVDLFVQDNLKTLEHETFELEAAIRQSRGGRLVLYNDDASSTGALGQVCVRAGGSTTTFSERPAGHFWRGNELGLCLVER